MSEAKAQIGFQQIGLGSILKQYRLRVPPNQREYSWTEREVTRLLQDFSRAIAEQEREYFLGTVVTIPRSPDLLEVVDGQQRLATTAILLAQIRNYLLSKEAIIAESITNSFLTDIDRGRRERVPKLQLNLDDNEYFRVMVSAPGGHEIPEPAKHSHELIQDAFKKAAGHIKNVVSGYDVKDHGDILNQWLEFVEHHASVILLKVPNDVNAYKMFETLNDRGLKTSQSDLVKNYLFGEARERLGEAQQKWALMRGALESLEEDDITVTFLRHALIAMRGHTREPDVFEVVQSQARGPQSAVAFLTNLETLANAYVAIFNPEHETWNSYPDAMRRAIRTLNLLNIRPIRPLMLAVAARFSEREASDAFQMFISWGVRLLTAASTRTGSVEQMFAGAAQQVFDGTIGDRIALKRNLSALIPNDQVFQQHFELMSVSKASLARYYLRSLEMTAKDEATPWFTPNEDRDTINLEHVLPVKPGDSWPQFDVETARVYVNRLGNLALLLAKQNCDLHSIDFAAKREVYAQAPYELTRQIATADEWTRDQISERQRGLAELALSTWPL
jgi:hypothetical protein